MPNTPDGPVSPRGLWPALSITWALLLFFAAGFWFEKIPAATALPLILTLGAVWLPSPLSARLPLPGLPGQGPPLAAPRGRPQ